MSSPQRLSRPFRALNSLGSGRAAATRAAKSKAKLQPPGRKRASGGDEGGQKQGKTATAGKDAGERRRRGRPPAAKLQPPGIEPGSPAWQASIIPLDHGCSAWRRSLEQKLQYTWSFESEKGSVTFLLNDLQAVQTIPCISQPLVRNLCAVTRCPQFGN